MIYKKFLLKEINEQASSKAVLEIYLYDNPELPFKKRPALLIVPGGAYTMVAPLESENVAYRYMSEGFNCFVLTYATNKPYPTPHMDLAIAVFYIKKCQEEFKLDSNLFMLGFSAGGHLVASYSYLYKEMATALRIDKSESLKPTALILSYPVISFTNNPHIMSRDILSGSNTELYEKLSVEKNITSDYPPTFIWTTLGDTCVNPSNSLDLISALKRSGVIYESFIYPRLDHGLSIVHLENKRAFIPFNKDELECKTWVDKSINFIINNFYK